MVGLLLHKANFLKYGYCITFCFCYLNLIPLASCVVKVVDVGMEYVGIERVLQFFPMIARCLENVSQLGRGTSSVQFIFVGRPSDPSLFVKENTTREASVLIFTKLGPYVLTRFQNSR